MQLHDILQLRTSVILPEAISDGGLAPTTDTSLFLTTYRTPLKKSLFCAKQYKIKYTCMFCATIYCMQKRFFSGVPIEAGVISHLIYFSCTSQNLYLTQDLLHYYRNQYRNTKYRTQNDQCSIPGIQF